MTDYTLKQDEIEPFMRADTAQPQPLQQSAAEQPSQSQPCSLSRKALSRSQVRKPLVYERPLDVVAQLELSQLRVENTYLQVQVSERNKWVLVLSMGWVLMAAALVLLWVG